MGLRSYIENSDAAYNLGSAVETNL